MRKLFIGADGKYYGLITKIEKTGNDLTATMPGDFPGMVERNVIFNYGTILYEDNDRVYIDYK